MGFDLSEPLSMSSECTETLSFGGHRTFESSDAIMATVAQIDDV